MTAASKFALIKDLPLDETPVALGFVARYARDNALILSTAQKHTVEYLKFLAIKSAIGRATPPPAIDAVFHQHITFTRSYARFCEALGAFVHHDPCVGGDGDELALLYAETLKEYRAAGFGEPPADVWIETGTSVVRRTSISLKELLILRRDAANWNAAEETCIHGTDSPPGGFANLFSAQLAELPPVADATACEVVWRLLGPEIWKCLADAGENGGFESLVRCTLVCKGWYVQLERANLTVHVDKESSEDDDEWGDCC